MPQNTNRKSEIRINNSILIPEIIKLINEGHTVTLTLKGFSMRPFLEDGRDKALLVQVKNPKVGDPVLAKTSFSTYVLHRIIKIEGNNVTLRGDGNLSDESCKYQDICASVEGFYRKGRTKLERTDGIKWKVYSWIWTRLFPIRRWLLAFYRRIWIKKQTSRRVDELIS